MEKEEKYTVQEKKELLEIARIAIGDYLKGKVIYRPEVNNKKFFEKRGVFVTLKKDGRLRGCIGCLEPIKPLFLAVYENAISAAFKDSRFFPLAKSEFKDIEIEISILTPPKPDALVEIIKNKKGVVLKKGNRGATYLPQVWESFSDSDQFFESLCLKAGLPADCYNSKDIEILSYQAIIFHE